MEEGLEEATTFRPITKAKPELPVMSDTDINRKIKGWGAKERRLVLAFISSFINHEMWIYCLS